MAAAGGLQDPATWGVVLRTDRLNGITQQWAGTAQTEAELDLPIVLFMHGWPESWFSWRHQLRAVRDAGYRGVAPDMRGYGGTDAPAHFANYGVYSLAGDMLSLLHHLGVERAALVGHDHGANLGWKLALMYPNIFPCYCAMSIPYGGKSRRPPLEALRKKFGDEREEGGDALFYYQLHHQLPTAADDYANDVTGLFRAVFDEGTGKSTPAPITSTRLWVDGKAEPLHRRMPQPTGLPAWLSQEEFDYFVSEFQRAGWGGGLNWYRVLDQDWHSTPQLQGAKLKQPISYIVGSRDMFILAMGGAGTAIELVKRVCESEPKILTLDGVGHWIQQEQFDAVNEFLLEFLHEQAATFTTQGYRTTARSRL